MSSLSLNASIRTCKVETGQAARIESDRFLNPPNMVCIPWSGYNNKGQQVSPDSNYTKTAGCNSAMDRVDVENDLRPDYAAYVNLNIAGIQGNIYGNINEINAVEWDKERNLLTGNYGNQWRSTNYQTCSLNSYERSMAQMQQDNREAAYANNAYIQNTYRHFY